MNQPMNIAIPDAARVLGVHRSTLYRMWRAEKLQLAQVGSRTFVPSAEVERLLWQVKKRKLESAE